MTEVIFSVAAKVAENLVDPTFRQGQYLFCANKITKNLLQKKEELALEKGRIQRRAEQAAKKTEIIEDEVKSWMEKVDNVLEEVERLEHEMEANKCCYQGWCPTWRRYHSCKQMVEKTKIMTDFKSHSQFDPFSHLAPLPGIEYESSKDFTYFESTKLAYNQLFEALRDDSTCMIGLYGMGGSGKTALVTEVGKKAKELKLFDLVLSVTVSQAPDIRSIQGKMADMLSLRLEEESKEGRAQRLSLKLKKEKQVLIIVDDLWTKFNLKDIGIQFYEKNKGSHKVLLTTRRQHVCSLMNCGRKISLGLLSEEEGWKLFKNFAAMDDQSSFSMIECVAQEVARECKGLPIAIKAVASSLKEKLNEYQLYEWKVALQKLKASELIDVEEEGERNAFSCIELSYNYLRNKEAQLLFFMCAMFPEDYEIFVEDLIRYGIGLGVCGEVESFDLARSQVKVGLNKLLDSCLLMHSEKSDDHVKMHDLVRDTALWISSKEDRAIMINTERDLNSLVKNGVTKNCFAVSSWYAEACEISYQWDAPKLEILILNAEYSWELSCASFDGMEALKVMAIHSVFQQSLSLPQSIQSLTNLRTLCLRKYDLGDISLIVSLRKLEVLDLRCCSFKEVPEGIEKLNKLKLLDLRESEVMENYNGKAIARCPQLQEFYVSGFVDRANIYPTQCFVHDLASTNLQRYELLFGGLPDDYKEKDVSSMRILKIRDFDVSTIVGFKNHLLQRAEEVEFIYLHGGWNNIITDMVRAVGGMNELRKLCLSKCEHIECLIDADSFQEDALLPRLVNLQLYGLPNLKELCRGRPVIGFFEKLELVSILSCWNIQNEFLKEGKLWNLKILNLDGCEVVTVFSMSVARSLQRLEELTLGRCPELRHIITNEGDEISLALNNSHSIFPNLKELQVYSCDKLQFVFPISCGHQGLGELQKIIIKDCDELKYVFGPYEHEHNNSSHDQNEIQIMLSSLQVFEFGHLENLIGMCPQNCHASCPSLRDLTWERCPRLTTSWICSQQHPNVDGVILWEINTRSNQLSQQQMLPVALQSFLYIKSISLTDNSRLEGILQIKVEGVLHVAQNSLHSNLTSLFLCDLPELRFIWSDPISFLGFHELTNVSLWGCAKLKTIFPPGIVGSLQNLYSLIISNCEELEDIIIMSSDLKVVCFPNLREISVHNCDKLKWLFSASLGCDFPKLNLLDINECNKLKGLFSGSVTCNLPKLSHINIKECSELERVFHFKPIEANDDKDHPELQLVLPELKELTLENLPNFTEIEKLKMQVQS